MSTNRVIFKYNVELQGFKIPITDNFKVLACQDQHGRAQVWIEIDTESEMHSHLEFFVIPTGMPFHKGKNWEYVSTFQVEDALVFHLYSNLTVD